jgi:UDP-N-acetyl-D-glucosamine dehydrogenase
VNDVRESPALEIIKLLEEEKAKVSYYDPYVKSFSIEGEKYSSLTTLDKKELSEKDIILITTDHTNVDYEMVAKNAKLVFDTRNVINSIPAIMKKVILL